MRFHRAIPNSEALVQSICTFDERTCSSRFVVEIYRLPHVDMMTVIKIEYGESSLQAWDLSFWRNSCQDISEFWVSIILRQLIIFELRHDHIKSVQGKWAPGARCPTASNSICRFRTVFFFQEFQNPVFYRVSKLKGVKIKHVNPVYTMDDATGTLASRQYVGTLHVAAGMYVIVVPCQ